jgi:hypothetical protein
MTQSGPRASIGYGSVHALQPLWPNVLWRFQVSRAAPSPEKVYSRQGYHRATPGGKLEPLVCGNPSLHDVTDLAITDRVLLA